MILTLHLPDKMTKIMTSKDPKEAMGAPMPTPKSPKPKVTEHRILAGIRSRMEDNKLLISEKVVCPPPINNPLIQKQKGTNK